MRHEEMQTVSEGQNKPRRRNLVVVRAGEGSIHESWLNAPGEERSWDLIVSYFGKAPDRFRDGDWLRIDGQGLKYQALHDLITSQEALIRQYEYVWFPDEDLAFTCEDANRFFERCRLLSVPLAQPALTPDSYFSHAITLHEPFFQVRYTSFVEIMAPCLRQDVLWKLLPTFKENHSGWGLDHVWPELLGGDASRIAIVDDVRVRHTRPVGGGQYYKVLGSLGKNAPKEYEDLKERYGISQVHYRIRGGITRSGREIQDGIALRFLYLMGLLRITPLLKMRWQDVPRFVASALYQQAKA
jgi:hypothetical protein